MKKYFALLLLASFLLPSCTHKKGPVKHGKATSEQTRGKSAKGTASEEELGAFELADDADKDLFESSDARAKNKQARTAATKPAPVDDAWAWQELDEDSSAEVIHFDFDQDDIKKDQQPAIKYDAQLAKLATDDGATVVVEGHSCMITHSQQYNQALSQRRADNVKKELARHGVAAQKVKAVGRGTSHLVTRKSGKDAQAPNRRVEVKFIYPK